jgi:YfiH family protein
MQKDFKLTSQNNIWFGYFTSFEQAGFTTACSTRLHGESDIVPGTLNLALHVGDNPQKVLRNRQKFAEAIGVKAERFTTCAQVHGSMVRVISERLIGSGALSFAGTVPETDALITNLADVPLLLFYADCVPVLLADPETGAIGLAHAGWRGTAARIVKKTVAAMQEAFDVQPENLLAAIGPSIGGCCYEVDDVVKNEMSEYESCFTAKCDGKYWLDLWQVNRQQLLEAGVTPSRISVAGVCTNHNPELFCSFRYENGRTGRMGVCLCRKG